MNILVTGAKGFLGRNLVENLKNIRDGKNRTRDGLSVKNIYEYDVDTDPKLLEEYCSAAEFVFHLAGVNRPEQPSEFMEGNAGFTDTLLDCLRRHGNTCPVMFASSVQASLAGRYAQSDYGKSKIAGEKLVFRYARETGSRGLVYRFPNIFGKWCRPGYNSAIATFCHAAANGLSYTVHDRSTELVLLYIDDFIEEMLCALEGREHRCSHTGTEQENTDYSGYCTVPLTYKVTLGEIADLLESFRACSDALYVPELPGESFAKKLYSTYLSYLPQEKTAYPLPVYADSRGVFAELIKTEKCGQLSVNITKPGCCKGEHWHNSKSEIFIVVSGHGLIQERKIGWDDNGCPFPVIEFEVTGKQIQAVQMLPGYTHSIRNLSETEDLVTVMWANEAFDPEHPDTFFERVSE